MAQTTFGFKNIKFAPLANDGGPGTVFTNLGLTAEDSASVTAADPTITELRAEEYDIAVERLVVGGGMTVKLTVMQADADLLVQILGGSVSTTTPKVYSAPNTLQVLEYTVQCIPAKGMTRQYNRVSFTAKPIDTFTKKGQYLLEMTGTVLVPTKANTPIWTSTNPA